jgi:transposase
MEGADQSLRRSGSFAGAAVTFAGGGVMEVLYPRCAGLDVHKRQVTVTLRVAKGSKVRKERREYGTDTASLFELRDWLESEGVTHVAMEATGTYWKPVWHVLEGAFELVLANARDVKNVPGRKSDARDSDWIADLLAHGLIRSSFVPPRPILELRDLTRTRKQLVRERGRHVQRIQKVLEDANIKLSSVVSDVTGLSGRKMLVALIEGERDPERLAELGSVRLKASKEELQAALDGFVREHHRFMLRLHLDQVNALEAAIQDVEARTEKCLEPFRTVVQRLDTIPGVSEVTAAVIVAEIGVDMSRFSTAGHLVSWAGLCPGENESAGKHRSRKVRKGAQWLKTTLVQAAWAAVKDKETYYHAKFLRLQRRRGSKRAIVAVAASMLTAAYHIIQRDQDFHDLGAGYFDQFDRERLARRLIGRLHQLGVEVQVKQPAA